MHQFVVLNHLFFSNVASVAVSLRSRERKEYPTELLLLAKKVYGKLEESRRKLGQAELMVLPEESSTVETAFTPDDELLREQLQFIVTISKDINKTAAALIEAGTAQPVHTLSVQAR